MEPLSQRFDRILVHPASWDSPVAERVRELFSPEKIVHLSEPLQTQNLGLLSANDYSQSKRQLYLAPFPGQFFKRCPGSRPGLLCCNYFVLNLGQQCDMDCSYCYLQSFINFPYQTIYTNIDQALSELRSLHQDLAQQKVRVGTGEVIDSLSLDPLTLFSRDLIRAFRDFPNWMLEFKTKSDHVEQFLDEQHAGNVVVSWSINPQLVIEREEHRTASLSERLAAAEKCRDRGFPVAFHIDPMIWHEAWQESYAELVDEVTRRFQPQEVPFLSVGALRFQPEQRHLMRERFGMKSLVTRAEVWPSSDGKLRYDRDLRQQMFEMVLQHFRRHDPNWRIFLCMETPETWTGTMDQSPFKSEQLADLFDTGVLRAHRRLEAQQSSQQG